MGKAPPGGVFAFQLSFMKTVVYIDGFNLYYGSLRGTRYKWLDLAALFKNLTSRKHKRLPMHACQHYAPNRKPPPAICLLSTPVPAKYKGQSFNFLQKKPLKSL